MLKHVKAIGWLGKEYCIAQVSMNLTNIEETPLHVAFDACVESSAKRGLRVTGSEIVGMVPKKSLTDAGRYFLRKQKWSEGVSEEELIDIAVKSMSLSELKPFDPKEKVIELKIESPSRTGTKKSLVKMNLREFCNETLSDSPAPGGGSVAALMGALGALLGGMAETGNPNSISDVGVGICAIRACIDGAALNVRINLANLKDEKFKSDLQKKVRNLQADSESAFKKIDQIVQSKLT